MRSVEYFISGEELVSLHLHCDVSTLIHIFRRTLATPYSITRQRCMSDQCLSGCGTGIRTKNRQGAISHVMTGYNEVVRLQDCRTQRPDL